MPKRIGYLYEKMCQTDTIRAAIHNAAKGKRKRHDVRKILENEDKYVKIIKDLLESESFNPAPYIVSERYDPHSKKTRIIQRPKFFPDQIIHWAVILAIQPTIMRGMYHWSCGSIPGRGSKHGQKAVKRWLSTDRKNTKYCLQLDIRHFYDNIPHDKLMNAMRRKIKDERALAIVAKIVGSTPIGVPIGNYTSQWFANFYLETLDHYIKEKLGAAYCVRYVDDILIFGRNKKSLHTMRKKLFQFIKEELELTVKGNWQVYPLKARGVDFLGYVFFHTHTKMRGRNFLSFTRQSRRVKKKMAAGEKIPYRMAAGLLSRAGQLKHCNAQNIKHKYYDPIKGKRLKEVIRIESKRKLRAARA